MAIDKSNAISQERVIHDGRSGTLLLWELLTEHPFPSVFGVIAALVVLVFPGLFLLASTAVAVIYVSHRRRPDTLPFFLPHSAKNKVDRNDPKIGKEGLNKPQGFIFWGTVIGTLEQLWAKFESALRHIMVLGTTGAGKTESLLSILASFLCVGGGGIYNDGKGTVKLYFQVFSIARHLGREDDVLCVNFTKENSSKRPDPASHISHSIAPFSFGSADTNTQQTTSLMPEESGGNNKVFSEGAIALITAVMPALNDLRELGLLKISPKVIRQYTNYLDYCKLMRHPMISETSRQGMLGFVRTRSGFDDKKPADKQPDEVTKQWGFNQAYFARALQMLSDSFANIYMYDTGEVDYRDVILNDRILVSILPSMSKSTEDMSQLGKMNLFAIRNALALGLGGAIEGTAEDVLDSNVTGTNRPSICINDEIAFYLAKGFMITAAQARGLMMVMLFSSQEFASIKNASNLEAEQMWANTRWKFIMASEGDSETFPRLQQLAGKAWAYVRTGLKLNTSGGLVSNYIGNENINLTQVDRLSIDDLRKLDEGEAFTFYKDQMIKTRMFYHGVERDDYAEQLRILSCPDPIVAPPRGPFKDILSNDNFQMMLSVRSWLKNLQAGDTFMQANIAPSNKMQVALNLAHYLGPNADGLKALSAEERGIAAIHGYGNALRIIEAFEHGSESDDPDVPTGGLLSNISGSFGNDDFDAQEGIINDLQLAELDEMAAENDDHPDDPNPPTADDIIGDIISQVKEGKSSDFENILNYLKGGDPEQDPASNATAQEPTHPAEAAPSPLSTISRIDDDDDDTDFAQFSPELANESLIDSEDAADVKMMKMINQSVNEELSSTIESDYLPANTVKRIAESTASLESMLGATPAQAAATAIHTVKQVVESVQYPKTKMQPTKDKLDVIKSILDDHIRKTQK